MNTSGRSNDTANWNRSPASSSSCSLSASGSRTKCTSSRCTTVLSSGGCPSRSRMMPRSGGASSSSSSSSLSLSLSRSRFRFLRRFFSPPPPPAAAAAAAAAAGAGWSSSDSSRLMGRSAFWRRPFLALPPCISGVSSGQMYAASKPIASSPGLLRYSMCSFIQPLSGRKRTRLGYRRSCTSSSLSPLSPIAAAAAAAAAAAGGGGGGEGTAAMASMAFFLLLLSPSLSGIDLRAPRESKWLPMISARVSFL
mmetsp:Transcript_36292/g.90618  ORF Transcript_36292/g.90618 Transcript_36292/m.90618 type:complete len:252 (-) Transcript_36292:360-1115(-)